ncbi:uncharacterized protein [Fopius arisanus]|uniref:Gingipain propeptide domain-containing protein n=2 Tax=Fopius arisanus TaxID=64838 RepID=A0A9R1TM67_9HYME|nr:PREDICTED: uncharacterized protein LOC105271586 [Fopius arisanus]
MFRFVFIVLPVILTIKPVHSRVLYLDPRSDFSPIYPDDTEQASRDLDLTFFAGESGENAEQIHPARKTIIYPSERSLAGNLERPMYYRISEGPVKRVVYPDPQPYERNRNLMRLNPQKGEVVLELRVIANNNNGI